MAVILAAAAAESLAAFPYYTAFFNVAVGGPKNGPKYLVDSNIDWGQDLKTGGRVLGCARLAAHLCNVLRDCAGLVLRAPSGEFSPA